jgi:probable F420-dependent oxidoreductase
MRSFPQQGADLGARLLYVFKWTHERQFERTIVTSSDSPQISTKEILPQEMLQLAAERSAGAHTYKVTAQHTADARQLLGPEALLAVEHAVVLETDPQKARRIARVHLEAYLRLPAHLAKFRRLGFTDDDFAAGGSNRLVDALVAWGHMDDVLAKLHAHFEAGADHVCIQVLGSEPGASPIQAWRIIAKAMLH